MTKLKFLRLLVNFVERKFHKRDILQSLREKKDTKADRKTTTTTEAQAQSYERIDTPTRQEEENR